MIKEEFDSLKIEEQIMVINSKLKEGLSLTKLCKNIEIGRSTISGRFKKMDIFQMKMIIFTKVYESKLDEFVLNNNILSPKKKTLCNLT